MTGGSVTTTEQFSKGSVEHSRADRRSNAEQDELDALTDEQKQVYMDFIVMLAGAFTYFVMKRFKSKFS